MAGELYLQEKHAHVQDETHLFQPADIYPIGSNSPAIHNILHQNYLQPLHAWFHAATVLFLM